ncbi:hypothetical protein HDV01_006514, partial [Terramyces sp. JEL0728]
MDELPELMAPTDNSSENESIADIQSNGNLPQLMMQSDDSSENESADSPILGALPTTAVGFSTIPSQVTEIPAMISILTTNFSFPNISNEISIDLRAYSVTSSDEEAYEDDQENGTTLIQHGSIISWSTRPTVNHQSSSTFISDQNPTPYAQFKRKCSNQILYDFKKRCGDRGSNLNLHSPRHENK